MFRSPGRTRCRTLSIAEYRAVQPRRKLPPSARRIVVIIRLKMDCKEKDRLLEEYDHGVNEWAKAVQNLKDAGMGQSRYLELLSLVDDARARTQRAEAAQAKHVAEHGF